MGMGVGCDWDKLSAMKILFSLQEDEEASNLLLTAVAESRQKPDFIYMFFVLFF